MQVATGERELVVGAAERARLVGLCTAVTRDRDAAEDLAQEALLQAWRIRHRLHDPAGRDRWLAAIARNVCRRWLRARGRDAAVAADVEAVPAEPAAELEVELERAELAELLDRALGLLPAATREVLVLRYVHDSPHAAIGERLGLSEDAVAMRLTRGKVVLRRVLAQELRDESAAHGLHAPDTGWRETRVWCPLCGSRRLLMLHEPPPGAVSFRCPGCSRGGESVSARFSFGNPVLARLLGGLVRPTAILARTADWQARVYTAGSATGRVPCAGCDAPVELVPYRREKFAADHANAYGLVASCPRCGEVSFCSSLAGIALSLPDVRAALGERPRTRLLPLREVERDGEPAHVLRLEAVGRSATADVVFARRNVRLLHLATTG